MLFSSSAITSEKLQKWLSKGTNADTIFSRMQLNKVENLLFYYPEFSQWVQYVDDLSAKYPGKATLAISTLTKQYGDDELYKLIEFAKKVSRQETLANRLQAEQMQHWVSVGKSPDDVFRLFDLQKQEIPYSQTRSFTYVDDINALNRGETTSMMPTLVTYYGDDVVFKMVHAAKNSDATKGIATKLEAQQIQGWLRSEKTPDNAFVQMGVGKLEGNLMANPLFSTWVKYLDDFNVQYPAKKTTLFQVLTKRFDDEALAKIVADGKTFDSTTVSATKLETKQIQAWLTSGKSSDDVFTLLKLDKGEQHFLLFDTWVSFVFKNGRPGMETYVFKTLTTHYSDKSLIKILEAAKKYPNLESTATKLQTEKIQGYLAIKKNPDEVLNCLDSAMYGIMLSATPCSKRGSTT